MRKKLFKILPVIFVACILMASLCINSFAASSATIALSSSSVSVGSTVTATVRFSSDYIQNSSDFVRRYSYVLDAGSGAFVRIGLTGCRFFFNSGCHNIPPYLALVVLSPP